MRCMKKIAVAFGLVVVTLAILDAGPAFATSAKLNSAALVAALKLKKRFGADWDRFDSDSRKFWIECEIRGGKIGCTDPYSPVARD
jgi:hypothetical protein